MSAIPASSVSLKTMADGTLRISFDIEPAQVQDAFRLFAAPGTQVAIAALKDGSFLEQSKPVQPIPPDSMELEIKTRAYMGDACYRMVTWCQEPTFWRFLNETHYSGLPGVTNKDEAAGKVCELCNVISRKELDTNSDANEAWHRLIREPYSKYLKSMEIAT